MPGRWSPRARGRRMTSMRSPALSWPGTATRRQVPAAPRAVNLFPHLGSALRHADLAHAMRGAAACGTAVPPVRQRAPASAPARSSPPGPSGPPGPAGGQLAPPLPLPLPPVQVLAGAGVHGLVRAAVMRGGADEVTGQAVRPRLTGPPGARGRRPHRPADRVLADAGPAGVMRRGQRPGREADRQPRAAAGCIHQPGLEPPPRRWPRINHGTGPVMPGRARRLALPAEQAAARQRFHTCDAADANADASPDRDVRCICCTQRKRSVTPSAFSLSARNLSRQPRTVLVHDHGHFRSYPNRKCP
jgi:hypothetical protein